VLPPVLPSPPIIATIEDFATLLSSFPPQSTTSSKVEHSSSSNNASETSTTFSSSSFSTFIGKIRNSLFNTVSLKKSNISLSPTPSEHIHNPDIPQIISLMAGYSNGINGKLCNIIYYDRKIGLEQIERLYLSVKDNNPPIFYPSLL
jgi:hypothetical protein